MNNQTQPQSIHQPRIPQCLRCKVSMQPIAQFPMRVGGSTGATLFFLDNWAEMSERIIIFDTFRCPNCRKLEFFDLDASLPNG